MSCPIAALPKLYYFLHRATGRYTDWRGMLIFASRRLEPNNGYLHRSLLNGSQVQSVYLDELPPTNQDSIAIGAVNDGNGSHRIGASNRLSSVS
jgi:predicted transposase YdaD